MVLEHKMFCNPQKSNTSHQNHGNSPAMLSEPGSIQEPPPAQILDWACNLCQLLTATLCQKENGTLHGCCYGDTEGSDAEQCPLH